MNPVELAIEEGRPRRRRDSSPDRRACEATQAQARTEYQFRRICDGLLSLPSTTARRAAAKQHHTPPSAPAQRIPQTSPERLARAAADHQHAVAGETPEASAPPTVLYLAYGSNLSAEVFRGMRGIKPLSATSVSAPALDLAFDLPGIPYQEPCFANVAPRRAKLPKPPKIPPRLPPPPISGDPAKTPPPPPPPYTASIVVAEDDDEDDGGDATWDKGLYGVVYEVTQEDYATIIATEGGGASYRDVLTPCVSLPPPLPPHIPEKPAPPVPVLPRPFLAHTLYAPHVPNIPGDGDGDGDGDSDGDDGGGGGGGGGGGDGFRSRLRRWIAKLARPPGRPAAGYAQPSPRYLGLIRDGAGEHQLPGDYQVYLERLRAYERTTPRQEVGRFVFLAVWAPVLLLVLGIAWLLASPDEEGEAEEGGDDSGGGGGRRRSGGGKVPRWVAVLMAVVMNLMWMSYDAIFKPLFGDGERTEETDCDDGISGFRGVGKRFRTKGDEESALLAGEHWKQ